MYHLISRLCTGARMSSTALEHISLRAEEGLASTALPALAPQPRLPAASAFTVQAYRQLGGGEPARAAAAGAGGSARAAAAAVLRRGAVNPKLFLAGERTMLHWLRVGVLVALTAVALLR